MEDTGAAGKGNPGVELNGPLLMGIWNIRNAWKIRILRDIWRVEVQFMRFQRGIGLYWELSFMVYSDKKNWLCFIHVMET